MKFKYIIVEVDEIELPLIFSPFLSHEDVSITRMKALKSAGYCDLDATGKWSVSGQSVSLQLGARPADAEILNSQVNHVRRLAKYDAK